MKIISFITVLFFLIANFVLPQNNTLYVPTNFQKAYKNGTRSYDGKPGPNYWQNKSKYKIKAELEPKTRKLSGEESITYFNNSPDTLKQIILRLFPDIYRKGNARDFEGDPDVITNGVEIEKLSVSGNEIKMKGEKHSPKRAVTNLFIPLEKYLPPKSQIELKVKWNYIIPDKAQIRTGAYDSTSFFVGYWYPQVAVYDDIDGWDTENYTGHTETYNDFSDYEVEILVPKGFLLWSTGVLQNPEEVYSQNIFEKYKKAFQSDEVLGVVEKKDYEKGIVTADKEKLTYKVIAENVTDFAFAASDHYLWDASSLVVDKVTGRRAFISSAYNISTNDFSTVAEVARKSIESFSTELPGIPYPYPVMTVFNGRGGMDFPMMCNNSAVRELNGTVHLTSHEIFHTYFPFYMGTNERKHAWIDEGFATMIPFDFQAENAPGYDPRSRNAQSYAEFAGLDTDIPPMVPSHQLKGASYRTASYRRPGAAFEFLRNFLGDEVFIKALHEFMYRWSGKHPAPYDFFFTFNEVTGEDLSWYWKPWFFETNYPDLSIENLKQENGNYECIVKNIGGMPVPVILKTYNDDGTSETVFNQSARIWKEGLKETTISFVSNKKIARVELGTTQIPDTDKTNNQLIIEK